MLPMGIDFIQAIIKDQVVCAAPIHKPSSFLLGAAMYGFGLWSWAVQDLGPAFIPRRPAFVFFPITMKTNTYLKEPWGGLETTCLAWLLEWLTSSHSTCTGVDAELAKMSASS